MEGELPVTLPVLRSHSPEIAIVARSFEQLLYRLRGYRALNVRRLLIEKRRADVIAASISDGIFLLRGEEITYMNSVGEKIMGVRGPDPDLLRKGLNLRTLERPNGGGEEAARAVLTCNIRALPSISGSRTTRASPTI